MSFASDNTAPVHPAILAKMAEAGAARTGSYGGDPWTAEAEKRLSDLFDCELAFLPVATGTAANALALSTIAPPWGAVLCHEEAHIAVDECNAPGHLSGGLSVTPLPGDHGKIAPGTVLNWLAGRRAGDPHQAPGAAISLTQATECGTLYRVEEIAAFGALAKERGLALHMDGARFANAVAALGVSPAAMTWKAGVGALSLGATKNGAYMAEAIILFDPTLREQASYRRMRAGHLLSKQRLIAAQYCAWLENELWLTLARQANEAARTFAEGLTALPGVSLAHPVEANEIFAQLPDPIARTMADAGHVFYPWGEPEEKLYRFVTSWDTDEAVVAHALGAAKVC